MDEQEQIKRLSTCVHRSVDKQKHSFSPCCGRTVEVMEYLCTKKKKVLVQPECFECKEYKSKEKNK